MRAILRALLRLLFSTTVVGRDRLRFAGPTMILPNHLSFADAIFLYAYLPPGVCFVVNTYIASRIGFVLRWVDHVTIDQMNPYSLKKIVNIVRDGRPVVIFPEGRISRTGSLMKVYSGIGFVALKTAATLYPVVFQGLEFSPFSRIRDKVRWRWFPAVQMYIGEAAQLTVQRTIPFRQQKKECSDRILTLLQQVMFAARQQGRGTDNLFDELLAAEHVHGSGKMIVEDLGGAKNYRQTVLGSYVLGRKLAAALGGEGNVGVLLPNSIGHLVTLFALFYLGKTPAILNFSAGAESCYTCSETAGVKTIITSRQFIEKGRLEAIAGHLAEKFRLLYLEDIQQQLGIVDTLAGAVRYITRTKAQGPGRLILFTSGSEGKPKGVVLLHSQIIANLQQIACVIDFTQRDRMLNALPMFHSFGLTAGTLLPVLKGVEVFLYPTPLHYKIIPEVSYDRNCTILLGTPTFLNGYAKYAHPYDFYSMRYVLTGGEKLKEEVRQLWLDTFGLRILEGYGTTETAPVLSINTPLFHRSGTVGRLLPGLEHRLEAVPGIAGAGKLLVKGPNVMAGYLFHDKGFVPAPEWYDCGDVVSVDGEGFVTIRARLKRFAKVSGEMVSLDNVERAAENCFGTDKNAAVNIPDEKRGERIILYTLYKGAGKQALRDYMVQNKQSTLAVPAKVLVLENLPLLGSGKTDYMALKEMALKEEAADD